MLSPKALSKKKYVTMGKEVMNVPKMRGPKSSREHDLIIENARLKNEIRKFENL